MIVPTPTPLHSSIKVKRRRTRRREQQQNLLFYFFSLLSISSMVAPCLRRGAAAAAAAAAAAEAAFISTLLLVPCKRRATRRLKALFSSSSNNESPLSLSLSPTRRSSKVSVVDTNHDDARNVHHYKHQQLLRASKLSLAPMMEYTDVHFRHLVRLISQETLLYTEMISSNAIAFERLQLQQQQQQQHDDRDDHKKSISDYYYLHRYLGQSQGAAALGTSSNAFEGPCVLQLGGSDPDLLRKASETVLDMTASLTASSSSTSVYSSCCDYTAINLNCGCPSPKVAGKGCFGAALMHEPQLVQELTTALSEGCQGRFPITVKCRIGTDTQHNNNGDYDLLFGKENYYNQNNNAEEKEYARLCHFIDTVAAGGVVTDFAIHARIAVLKKSYSPSDNRKIPPLKYHYVQRLIHDFPHLTFSLNGGIETLQQVDAQLKAMPGLQGVMVGRAWAADPWGFAMADSLLYNDNDNNDGKDSSRLQTAKTVNKNRLQILQAYGRYADAQEVDEQNRAMETGHYPQGIRRFLVKAVSHLFAGEGNAKRFRVALDDIANQQSTFIKKTKQISNANGLLLTSSTTTTTTTVIPPGASFSELLVNIAMEHLSEDVLLETPVQSHERRLAEEQHRQERRQQQHSRSLTSRTMTSQSSSSSSSGSILVSNITDGESQSSDAMSRVEEWQQERRSEKQQSN